jgi:hypothetical protein
MKCSLRFCLSITSLLASSLAHGEREPQPIPRDPRKGCPYGYGASGAYCKPYDDKSKYAVPRGDNMRCPYGYYASGSGCLAYDNKSRNAIPKVGQCPYGYNSSGDYCLKSQVK